MNFWRGWSERLRLPSKLEAGKLLALLILAVVFCPIAVSEATGADTSEAEVQPHNLRPSVSLNCLLGPETISRKADGLKGAVQTVLDEFTFFQGLGQQKKEGPRELFGLTFYDRFGTKIAFIGGCSRLKGHYAAAPDYCKYSIARDGLGRVNSVVVIDDQSDLPSTRPPLQTTRLTFSYDTQGNLTRWSKVWYDGSVTTSEVKYDSDGRVTEVKTDEKNATFFRYGPNKKLLFTQTVSSLGLGGHGPRKTGIYNEYGDAVELIEDVASFGDKGTFTRCSFTHDRNGNLLANEKDYVSDFSWNSGYSQSKVAFRWHYDKLSDQFVAEHIWPEREMVTETDAYDRNGTLMVSTMNQGLVDQPLWVQYVFAHEFDSVGNWVKQTSAAKLLDDSLRSPSPHRATYRQIIYYPDQP